jgi:hypothetical protein
MLFIINDTFRYKSSGSLDDVIYAIRYEFEDSGSSNHDTLLNYESYRYFLNCDPVTSENYVGLNSLTTSLFQSWIQDSYGANWGSFTSSLESTITTALNSRTSSKPIHRMQWTSGSMELPMEAVENDILSTGRLFFPSWSAELNWPGTDDTAD